MIFTFAKQYKIPQGMRSLWDFFIQSYSILFFKFSGIASLFDVPILGKPPETGSARLGHIPSLPWESQLPLKPCISLQPFHFKRQLRFYFGSLLDFTTI